MKQASINSENPFAETQQPPYLSYQALRDFFVNWNPISKKFENMEVLKKEYRGSTSRMKREISNKMTKGKVDVVSILNAKGANLKKINVSFILFFFFFL